MCCLAAPILRQLTSIIPLSHRETEEMEAGKTEMLLLKLSRNFEWHRRYTANGTPFQTARHLHTSLVDIGVLTNTYYSCMRTISLPWSKTCHSRTSLGCLSAFITSTSFIISDFWDGRHLIFLAAHCLFVSLSATRYTEPNFPLTWNIQNCFSTCNANEMKWTVWLASWPTFQVHSGLHTGLPASYLWWWWHHGPRKLLQSSGKWIKS